ncbi:MAG: alcohol dehydrogenase catalytic domain-containing protein [Actinomycetota bacterium]|nr:alcohol dehydrogenase catalytic domain-containing protein [Actinomycetota bacterium]
MTMVTATVALGEKRLELDEFPIPSIPDTAGLLRVEACGVCGSDVKKYARSIPPMILGHETVGRIEQVGDVAAAAWGVEPGDRVMLEEYLPCGHCGYCRSGEYRSCASTELGQKGTLRYGSTPLHVAPALWGGYSQYQFLHLKSVLHRVPDGVTPEQATFALPLSNGIQWAQIDAGVRPGSTVVVQGPGQQGLACVIAAKAAGAERIIVTGLAKDGGRLALARDLGATDVVDVSERDLAEAVLGVLGGRLADVSIDVTGVGAPTLNAAVAFVRKRGTVVLASGSGKGAAPVDIDRIRKQQLTVLGVRGHSYAAVESALAMIASGSIPSDRLCTSSFGLSDLDAALETTAGLRPTGGVHVTVAPWHDGRT